MADDSKVLKALESLDKRLDGLEKGQAALVSGQAGLEKGQAGLEKGQKQIREDVKIVDMKVEAFNDKFDRLAATKADIQDLDAKLVKKVQSHERRINTLEDEQGIPHPNKN